MYGSIFGVGLSVIQFGSWWWMCTCEIPSVLGLSYQVTLHSQRRTLLANCPHKAETVNSQARPVTMCLQVGACVSVQADSVEFCSHGNSVAEKDRPISNFTTPFGLFKFWVMPFGLSGAPQHFSGQWTSSYRE